MKQQKGSEILWSEVFRLIESGKTRASIARELGISVGQLRYRLKRHLEQQNDQTPTGEAENPGVNLHVTNSKTLFDETWHRSYGENRLAILVKDPRTIHAYWEVSHLRKRLICEHFQSDWSKLPFFLQVYDVTDIYFNGLNAHSKRLIQVHPLADNWYIHDVLPNRNYIVDYGTTTIHGQFFSILRSNVAKVPAEHSEITPMPGIRFGAIRTSVLDSAASGYPGYNGHSNQNGQVGQDGQSDHADSNTAVPVSTAQILQDGTAPYAAEFDGYSVVTVRERDGQ
jgi:hypothetical protein